jgi:hypothetical protein
MRRNATSWVAMSHGGGPTACLALAFPQFVLLEIWLWLLTGGQKSASENEGYMVSSLVSVFRREDDS